MKVIYAPIIPIIEQAIKTKSRPIESIQLSLEEAEAFHDEIWALGEKEMPWMSFRMRGQYLFKGTAILWDVP